MGKPGNSKNISKAVNNQPEERFYATYYDKNGKPVVGTWVNGKGSEEAISNAEFKIMAMFPNVDYSEVKVDRRLK